MPILTTCEHCFIDFPASTRYAGRAVKCPGCGERIVIPTEEELAEEEDGLFLSSEDIEQETTEEELAEQRERKQRKAKKKKKRKRKKAAASVGSFFGEVFSPMIDFVAPFWKILACVAVVVVLLIGLKAGGIIGGRTYKTFVGEYGEARTTPEWLEFVYKFERDEADGVEMSRKRTERYIRITKGITTFMGPDPAALPEVFAALEGDIPGYRFRTLLETILEKFVSTRTKARLGDIDDGLASENSRVVYWALKLLALHGTDASGYESQVQALVGSDDAEVAAAAKETLEAIR